jgi:Raf kinase inhibitor-like YbhB/YbcL family protein
MRDRGVRPSVKHVAAVPVLLALLVSACDNHDSPSGPTPPRARRPRPPLTLTSPAFPAGGRIPEDYLCTGLSISPPLAWTGGPLAQTYALLLEDPEAPGGVVTHWILYNLPGVTRSLPENASPGGLLPFGTLTGLNDLFFIRYSGPCPSPGLARRYVFRLFAVNEILPLVGGATAEQVREAMRGHELAETVLTARSPR